MSKQNSVFHSLAAKKIGDQKSSLYSNRVKLKNFDHFFTFESREIECIEKTLSIFFRLPDFALPSIQNENVFLE
jgi:hypothetical protein